MNQDFIIDWDIINEGEGLSSKEFAKNSMIKAFIAPQFVLGYCLCFLCFFFIRWNNDTYQSEPVNSSLATDFLIFSWF